MNASADHLRRVAEAIWRADENAHESGWWEVNAQWRDHYQRLAQAALDALDLREVWSVGTEDAHGYPVDWRGYEDTSWEAARRRGLYGDQFVVSRLVGQWANRGRERRDA